MTTNPCYSGLVPTDLAFQNLDVNSSLRARTAAIGKLCAGIDFTYKLLHGSLQLAALSSEGFSVFALPSGRTSTTSPEQGSPSLSTDFYTPVDIDITNFSLAVTANNTDMTVAIEVSDPASNDPTTVTPLANFTFELTTVDPSVPTIVESVPELVTTIPAGSYITIRFSSNQIISTCNATWSLEVRNHLVTDPVV